MRRVELVSYIVFGLWFLLWLVLELLALRPVANRLGIKSRWLTLSETAWTLERHAPWLRIVFAIGLGLLTVHIAAPHWP